MAPASKRARTGPGEGAVANSLVPCPICGRQTPLVLINQHLDLSCSLKRPTVVVVDSPFQVDRADSEAVNSTEQPVPVCSDVKVPVSAPQQNDHCTQAQPAGQLEYNSKCSAAAPGR